MRFQFQTKEERDAVAKRFMFLAYQMSMPMGLGWLHERSDVTEEQVHQATFIDRGNYKCYASDYVFGRMMKTGIDFVDDLQIEVSDFPPRADYQSWARHCPSFQLLVEKAMSELNIKAVRG